MPRSILADLRRPGGAERAWLSVVLALAVMLKLLVPQGWMPSPGGGLMLCPDQVPAAAAPMAHRGHHAMPADQQPEHAMPDGERCAFAGLGLAAAPAAPMPVLALPRPLRTALVSRPYAVAVGRGLAAPPPPATGPPALT